MHSCDHLVVCCIDFRFQKHLINLLANISPHHSYDRVGVAGTTKDLTFLISQIEISHKLHDIKTVHLIIHQDCGAYAKEGSAKQKQDLDLAVSTINNKFPGLTVKSYFLKLDGLFEEILLSK